MKIYENHALNMGRDFSQRKEYKILATMCKMLFNLYKLLDEILQGCV